MADFRSVVLPQSWPFAIRAQVLGVAGVGLAVAGLLYLGLPIPYLPLILAGAVLAVLTLKSPALGLAIVLAMQYLPVMIGQVTIVQIVGGIVAVLTLVWYGANKRGIVFGNVILPMICTFLLTLYSFAITKNFAVTLGSVRKLFFNIILCLLVVNVLDSYRKLRLALWVLVAMGVINSLAAFYQHATGQTLDYRAKGLLENENLLGEMAATAFLIPFYVYLYSSRRWERVLGMALAIILAGGLLTSISRGAILAFTCGLGLIIVRERRSWSRIVLFIALAACIYPFLSPRFFRRFERLGQELRGTVVLSERQGLSTRGFYNKAGMKIWKAHPFLGVGIGNYGYYFIQPQFNPGMLGTTKLPPHNIYVQALAETGTIGFLFLCWWILQAGYNYWKAEMRAPPEEDRMILRASETVTLVALIAAFASGSLTDSGLAIVLAISFVCLRASKREAEDLPAAA